MPMLQALNDVGIVVHTRQGRFEVRCGGTKGVIVPLCVTSARVDNRPDEDKYIRLRYSPDDGHLYLTDRDGQFVEALRHGAYRLQEYQGCMNNPTFVGRALELIKSTMKGGADGIVLRYDGTERTCYAENMHVGHVEGFHSMTSQIPWFEQYDKRVLALPEHVHIHPGRDQPYAFGRFLRKAVKLVRGRGKEKVVFLEADLEFVDAADGMLVRVPPGEMDSTLERLPERLRKPVLLWPFAVGKQKKADTLTDLAKAWIHGCAYVLDGGVDPQLARRLRNLNRGKCLCGTEEIAGVRYRVYENCVVAVNRSETRRMVRLKLPQGYPHSRLTDLNDGKTIGIRQARSMERFSIHDLREEEPKEMDLVVKLPPHSGRLYVRARR